MIRIPIHTDSASYAVVIAPGSLKTSGRHIAQAVGPLPKKLYVISVPPVYRRWGSTLRSSLKAEGSQAQFILMRDGERFKTLKTVEQLATKLVRLGADRKSILVALGGGVVGDVSGLLASLYMRGITLVQIPTTFLAQVDAAIGGKTGVNLAAGKNLLGTFHQPQLVLIDPATLSTLPQREFRAGLFEALKCGMIHSPEIFAFMEKERERVLARDAGALEWLITECVKVKAAVVHADERESDLRRILNFGHTIGHALEAETGYRHFLHGEAVGWGMVAACLIAMQRGWFPWPDTQRVIAAVQAYGPLPRVRVSARKIARRILFDKKTSGGVPHFVLPKDIGRVEIANDVCRHDVLQAIEELQALSRGK